jgi:nucleotide-binding universal stress UspA family protein
MYKKIVVPLDGSAFSECSLPHAQAIASGCQVPSVVLLRVIEPLSSETISALAQAGGDLLREVEMQNKVEARDYMAKMGNNLKKQGFTVETVTIEGRPEEQILKYVEDNHADLIIITTHGRSGPSRWIFGSVADKIMRHAVVPVMMVAPAGCVIGQ